MSVLGRNSGAGAGSLMAIAAMCSAQLAGAIAVALSGNIRVEDFTWLRLIWASALLAAVVKPWRISFSRRAILSCTALGLASGAMTLLCMSSITLLPLSTATALQFLGPLVLAVVRSRGRLIWSIVLAAVGVMLLTQPWDAGNAAGILLALAGGLCWAVYILLTQRAGDDILGLHALALSVPVSALLATFAVGPAVLTRIPPSSAIAGLGVALLLPVATYLLELLALQRITAGSFGILMSLQPAIAVSIGFVFLAQVPSFTSGLGVLLVMAASFWASLSGKRHHPPLGQGLATK